MKIIITLFITTLVLSTSTITHAQLYKWEQQGKIYHSRPTLFGATKYRLNGNVIRDTERIKLLMSDSVSKNFLKLSKKNSSIGMPFALVALTSTYIALFKDNNRINVPDYRRQQALVYLGVGLASNAVANIFIRKSAIYNNNALAHYNKETLWATPNNQINKENAKDKILYSPNFFSNAYYYNNEKISKKEVLNLIANNTKTQAIYQKIEKNRKAKIISGLVGLAAFSYPIANNEWSTPIAETKNPGLSITSVMLALSGFTVSIVSSNNQQQYIYNGYKIYNGEAVYPFNKRHQRILNTLSKIKLGAGNFGYGILVKL